MYEQMGRAVREKIKLENLGNVAALETKLTLLDMTGLRILPAYFNDNYVSLLPGETREITLDYEAQGPGETRLAIRGWNVTSRIISASEKK
jgi:hypothetical protein